MSDTLGHLDSWPAIILGVMAGLAALLVPFTGFVKTLLDFKVAYRQAEAMKPNIGRDIGTALSGAMIGDSIASQDLVLAIRDLTMAINAAVAADKAHHQDRAAQLLEQLAEKIGTQPEPRRGR